MMCAQDMVMLVGFFFRPGPSVKISALQYYLFNSFGFGVESRLKLAFIRCVSVCVSVSHTASVCSWVSVCSLMEA